MSGELRRAELKRAGLRPRCETLCCDIQAECQKPDKERQWTTLQAKIQCLHEYEEDLLQLNRVIEQEADDDFLTTRYAQELEANEQFAVRIKETVLMFNAVVGDKGGSEVKSSKTSETDTEGGSGSGSRGKVAVRLPVLDVPTFAGELIEFTPFIQAFEATIHDNEQLSSLDKFSYLRSMVKGEALEVIKPLPVTVANYKLAIQRLKDRFGRPENLINAHVQGVWNLKKVKDASQFPAMKDLVNKLEFHIAALKGLDMLPIEYNRVFFCVVAALVPSEVLKRLDMQGLPLEVDALLTLMKEEVSRQHRCEAFEQLQGAMERGKEKPNKIVRTAAALYVAEDEEYTAAATGVAEAATTAVNRSGEFKPFCALCKRTDHWTDACKVERRWEEKFSILTQAGRCYRCAARGHRARECNYKRAACVHCAGKHLSVLCSKKEEGATSEVTSMTVQVKPGQAKKGKVLLQTAHALVMTPAAEKKRDLRVLLDGGAQCSFINQDVARDMRLRIIDQESVKLNTIGGLSQRYDCNKVLVPLYNRYEQYVGSIQALAVPKLSMQELPYPNEDTLKLAKQFNLDLADVPILHGKEENHELDVLIGADQYWSIVQVKRVELQEGLIAVETKLGWVLQGPQTPMIQEPRCDEMNVMFIATQPGYDDLKADIQKIWDLDAMLKPESKEETLDSHMLEIKRHGKGYEAALPWRRDKREVLDNNAVGAQQRLHSLIRRLKKQPGMMEAYHQAMMSYVNEGHAAPTASRLVKEKGYYMPHRAVIRSGTTTDLRVVFDASAKVEGKYSLNDCLWPGDDRHLDVVGMLIRFRLHRWAMTSDIRKAFLQIKVKESDWDYLKFLWLHPDSSLKEPYEVTEYSMTCVTFGVNASPFILKSVIKHHLLSHQEGVEELVEECLKNTYVDDVILSEADEDDMINDQSSVSKLFLDGGFELRKWTTNSENARERWKQKGFDVRDQEQVKVLGIGWNVYEDRLINQMPEILFHNNDRVTKREVIKTISSIFDPLGILAVIVVKAKMLFQRLWKLKYGWDENVEDRMFCKDWQEWRVEMLQCQEVTIDRWGGFKRDKTIELHAFNDASPQAFGAVLWLKVVNHEGEDTLHFLIARYRVAPLKDKSLPQLELMSAEVAAMLADYWKSESGVEPQRCVFWTDSEIVLKWIKGEKVRDSFVEPKLKTIRKFSKEDEWRHCPGTINPADFGTRKEIKMNSDKINEWLKGPEWLIEEARWSCKHVEVQETEVIEVGAITEIERERENKPYWVCPPERGSWRKGVRVMAWVIRFLKGCRRYARETSNQLKTEELRVAKRTILSYIQARWYKDEINCVKEGKVVSRSSSLHRFQLRLDRDNKKELLRVKSRFMEGPGLQINPCPIVLPGKDYVVRMIMKDCHERLLHTGVNTVTAELRQEYWITKSRVACKRVIKECYVCRRQQGKPFAPATGMLPEVRYRPSSAFVNIGVDFAGPCYIREGDDQKKVYILLITWLYSRAVHLEIVSDLSTEKFILGFQRFMARRGQPTQIISDNAKTFKKAKRILQKVLEYGAVLPKLSFFKWDTMAWRFSVERAPWMGGVWERMVQTVKVLLRKTVGNAELDFEELGTLIAVIESVVNSRPLTAEPDSMDEGEVITPNHLIIGRSLKAFPMYEGMTASPELQIMQRYQYLQTLLQHFSKRWVNEYVSLLKSNHIVEREKEGVNVPKLGEVVLIKMDNIKRQLYPLGRVVKLNIGRDGQVRSVMLKLVTGGTICRPVKLLYPLEDTFSGPGSVEKVGGGEKEQ